MKTIYKVIKPAQTVKHEMRWIKKAKRWNEKYQIDWFLFIFIFPLIIGAIYALPLPQIIAIDSGDLLAFYGTAFGIFKSFQLFYLERKKEEKERNRELKPHLLIKIDSIKQTPLFDVYVENKGEHALTDCYMYDEYVSKCMDKNCKCHFIVSFNQTIEKFHELKSGSTENIYNITMDNDIMKDGYPKYIYFICDDIDGNEWYCSYIRIQNGKDFYYYPEEIKIQAVG